VGAKLTQKDFIQRGVNKYGDKYNYSKSIYDGNKKNVIITCYIHGDFKQTPERHWAGEECKQCVKYSRGYNTETFIKRSNKIHFNKYNYSKSIYVNSRIKIIINCPKHGDFKQTSAKHLQGRGCINCSVDEKYYDNESFILKAKNIHGNKYNYDKIQYKSSSNKIIITCLKHGDFNQLPANHLCGKGCPDCGKIIKADKRRRSLDEFIILSNNIYNNKYTYKNSIYINTDTHIVINCNKHGDFLQTPASHLAGKEGCCSCANIKVSKMEKAWLTSLSICESDRQKRIYINNKNYYIVDAYVAKTNTVYEFYGDYWHGNPSVFNLDEINKHTNSPFKYLYRKTLKKENNLLKLNYNIAYIWESDFKAGKPFTLRSSHNKLDQYKGIK